MKIETRAERKGSMDNGSPVPPRRPRKFRGSVVPSDSEPLDDLPLTPEDVYRLVANTPGAAWMPQCTPRAYAEGGADRVSLESASFLTLKEPDHRAIDASSDTTTIQEVKPDAMKCRLHKPLVAMNPSKAYIPPGGSRAYRNRGVSAPSGQPYVPSRFSTPEQAEQVSAMGPSKAWVSSGGSRTYRDGGTFSVSLESARSTLTVKELEHRVDDTASSDSNTSQELKPESTECDNNRFYETLGLIDSEAPPCLEDRAHVADTSMQTVHEYCGVAEQRPSHDDEPDHSVVQGTVAKSPSVRE